ncbi:hypothetical protein SAMN05421636_108223 [Pricia antarctica]|uniref:Uncharacterized protein n=1 Tax=Pricia antarctica TaxID=641691 RepID=A0A1G7GNN9_9FLAO|nr:hypothetical protein SAMN05421636_108223 [Pricia antarctica]
MLVFKKNKSLLLNNLDFKALHCMSVFLHVLPVFFI